MANEQAWKLRNGVWEQELGFMTKFYASLTPSQGHPMHWMIASAVKYNYSGPSLHLEDAFRSAWVEMRYKYPALASQVVGHKKVYRAVNDDTLTKWLASSFKIHRDQSANQILRELVLAPFITLHCFPSSKELMITTAHTFMDGRGMLLLYNAFFSALTNPGDFNLTSEASRLPLTEDELLGLGDSTERDRKNAVLLLERYLQDKPIMMPVKNMGGSPAGTSRQELKLSIEETNAVIRVCKQRHFSVTSAWHAALIFAVRNIQATAGEIGTSYTSFTSFDLRPYFPTSFNAQEQPVSCYHTGIPFHVTAEGKSFDGICLEVHEQYQAGFKTESVNIGLLPIFGELVTDSFAAGPQLSSTPVLSSIGIMDRFLSSSFGSEWKIEDVWLADTMQTPEIEAFLWSWAGQIVLSGSFNEAFYGKEEVMMLLKVIKEELFLGLGI